jgi:hypothetical protein
LEVSFSTPLLSGADISTGGALEDTKGERPAEAHMPTALPDTGKRVSVARSKKIPLLIAASSVLLGTMPRAEVL